MKKSTKITTVLLSSAAILTASAIVVGATYSLFTDTVELSNHFVAGNLDLTLKRVALNYTICDSEGIQQVSTDSTEVDFSEPTEANLFGFGADDLMVPTDYREVTLQVSNASTVAYDYYATIALDGNSNAFAEQLKVEVETDSTKQGYEYTAKLSDGLNIGTAASPLGTVKVGSSATFTIRITFIDDTQVNNNAQDLEVSFDATVYAVQHIQSSN